MTNKEFFIKTLDAEIPVFIKVIEATPGDNLDFKPHEKARTARSLMMQLGSQPVAMSQIITKGTIDTGAWKEPDQSVEEAAAAARKNFDQLKEDLAAIPDEEWENSEAKFAYPGGEWKAKKCEMVWGFLLDGIHHRGQLSTYIRIMGGKVPSIYGGSADERPGA